MSQFFQIHPENPQLRLINQAVSLLRKGGVVVYPTDSGYSLGCHIGDKEALRRIRRIRQLDEKHPFTLVCKDLSEIGLYAKVDNSAYRFMKAHTPGPFTFILSATREVPRRLQHPKRKTIGYRVPDNNIALNILEAMGEPIMNTSLILPGDKMILIDIEEIRQRLENQVDLIIDGGYCGDTPTTVIDMTGETPSLVRQGAGQSDVF
jgi:tRNA threonylcarbamoyl adenosine modification protein (Sua5/YciO/YrdC/YwlC family)